MTWTAITDDEVRTLGLDGKLSQATEWLYRNVSKTQLSIAWITMGLRINGHHYVYCPPTDELIRDDVLKAVQRLRKQHQALDRLVRTQEQMGLYE
jgi:hypothetical protein